MNTTEDIEDRLHRVLTMDANHAPVRDLTASEFLARRVRPLPVQTGRPGRRTVLTLVAASAAALLVAPVIAVHGSSPGASADAATLLQAAGRAAGAQNGGWPDAAYWHSVSRYERDGHSYQREVWIGHHAPGVLKDPGVDKRPISLGDAVFPAGRTSLTWDQIYELPTDPRRLTAVLQRDVKGADRNPDAELFATVGDLLRESPAPPALRRALYDVAADIPGIRVNGKFTDSVGRTGTSISRNGVTYVIDTRTGRLLGEVAGGFRTVYLSQGPATSAPGPADS